MSDVNSTQPKKLEKLFLNERFMAAACMLSVAFNLASLVLCLLGQESFETFQLVIKLVTTVSMLLAFRSVKWDVAKGLMGGVLFSLMYQEAFLVFVRLWGEQNFDTYLVAGVQGSLYLAGAGMSFLMTVIITINHFLINYSSYGNPKNVILNRIALVFKFGVYILLVISNSMLGVSADIRWNNLLQYLADVSMLLLIVSMETQFDSFNALRRELHRQRRERRRRE